MFSPLTVEQMRKALTGETLEGTSMGIMSIPYTLALFACGGPSQRTDEVARHIAHRLPTLLAEVTRKVNVESKQFVGVQFEGNDNIYHYSLPEEDQDHVEMGDLVAVWSPATSRVEYAKVVKFGRGGYTGPISKKARAVPFQARNWGATR